MESICGIVPGEYLPSFHDNPHPWLLRALNRIPRGSVSQYLLLVLSAISFCKFLFSSRRKKSRKILHTSFMYCTQWRSEWLPQLYRISPAYDKKWQCWFRTLFSSFSFLRLVSSSLLVKIFSFVISKLNSGRRVSQFCLSTDRVGACYCKESDTLGMQCRST